MASIAAQLKDWLDANQGTIDGMPTGVGRDERSFLDACCAIHKSATNFGDRLGCDGWKPGTHAAIRAIDEGRYHFCDTMEGQRKLDWLFSTFPFNPALNRQSALERTNSFKRRFAAGSYAHTSVYGSGYCYIAPFMSGIKNRVARILGPNPLVSDVLRYLVYAGDFETTKFNIRVVRPGFLHLSELKHLPGHHTVVSVLNKLFQFVLQDPLVRIGVESDDFEYRIGVTIDKLIVNARSHDDLDTIILQAKRDIMDAVDLCDPTPRVVFELGSLMYRGRDSAYGSVSVEPFGREFVSGNQVLQHFPTLFSSYISRIVLLPLAAHAVAGPGIRDQMRVLAMVGDSILRFKVCAGAVRDKISPSRVSDRLLNLSNASFSSLFVSSGLKSISQAHEGSSDKEKADAFECFVGYAYYVLSDQLFDRLIFVLGIKA